MKRGLLNPSVIACRKKGFSLVELLIIILIVGVLAAIAIPTYFSYRKKAISVEATTNLLNLYKYEQAFFVEKDRYTSDLKELNFNPTTNPYYTYSIAASTLSFTAEARGNIDSDDVEDVWRINDMQTITHDVID